MAKQKKEDIKKEFKKMDKPSFFIKNFKDSWNFIKSSKKQIYFGIGIFLAFIVISLIFPAPLALEEQIKIALRALAEKVNGLDALQLVEFIFWNNLFVSVIGIFLGIIFCIAPFIIASSNGYILGYVIKKLVEKLGFSDGIINLWRLLPHGFFELPAVLISLGIGIKLGLSLISSLSFSNKNSFKEFGENILKAFKTTIFIILPLLLIAAIIEGILIKMLG